ncbi:type II secretion system F family protein [Haloarcula sp. JP-L23]|uniref:type II secretion system F family protein n=1 Tax=Haloarcula sp. JP-L23 TaxID=2716717 RepID=UPI00140F30D0|nr:hypothetical protein G9465_03015 [Haloarcula sp. JP-L23]
MSDEYPLLDTALSSPTTWPILSEWYARLRSYFRERTATYDDFRRNLMKAHMPVTYDDYLARSAIYAVIVGVAGIVGGGLLTAVLVEAGLVGDVDLPVSFGQLGRTVAAYEGSLKTVGGALLAGVLFGYGAWQAFLRWPASKAAGRKRQINVTLPHAIVFLYALTSGGMNVIEAMRALADAEDSYGETSREFRRIVEDMRTFGTDLPSALRNAREATPSKAFEQFLDDMLTVIDTGGDLTSFFESESDRYLTQARNEQEDLIEFLSLIAEMYITLLVAGPLFLIILLLVIGLLGGSTITQVYVIIYAGVPLLSLALLVLLDTIAEPFTQTNWQIDEERRTTADRPEDDAQAKQYARRKRRKQLLNRLRDPVQLVSQYPSLSLVVTVPAAALIVGALSASGLLTLSYESMLTSPVGTTTGAVILPFYLVSVPYMGLKERARRRRRRIEKRFPDVLAMISNANEIGLTLAESFSLVATRDNSAIAPELRKVHNDIEWNGDIGAAMVRLANRLRVPSVSRTMRLLVEANRSTSNLHQILGVAAEDANSQERLKAERASEVSAYTAVVVITFFVFLGIIVMLDVFFLDTFAAQATPDTGEMGAPTSFNGLAIEEFRMAFFHASLVQALFGGLLAGKMAHNETAVGLKYSIALVTLSVLVFLVL